ncbi:MAG TPA: methionine ABC transporter ATP-binding protein, partial [Lachnospiraceae bacterium]|nr:methionine ABC transporter ATP-binding protein [Lachnospiraceae bacterium]
GCVFWPRCLYATETCMHRSPELREIYDGHFVACHYMKNKRTLEENA